MSRFEQLATQAAAECGLRIEITARVGRRTAQIHIQHHRDMTIGNTTVQDVAIALVAALASPQPERPQRLWHRAMQSVRKAMAV